VKLTVFWQGVMESAPQRSFNTHRRHSIDPDEYGKLDHLTHAKSLISQVGRARQLSETMNLTFRTHRKHPGLLSSKHVCYERAILRRPRFELLPRSDHWDHGINQRTSLSTWLPCSSQNGGGFSSPCSLGFRVLRHSLASWRLRHLSPMTPRCET
jgi:hypothetical protein